MKSSAMPVPDLDLLQELQDLGLHRDVERRGRLVGDQEVGFVGERHGDHDALALAAGELVRIGAEPLLRVANADFGQQFEDALARPLAGRPLMDRQDLADLPLDRVQRIERRHRLLEDHGDAVAADPAQFLVGRGEQIMAVEQDLAAFGCSRRRIGQQLQHRERRHRLARAGFADQRDGLARADGKGHAIDRDGAVLALDEMDGEDARRREGGRSWPRSDRRRVLKANPHDVVWNFEALVG